MRHFKTYILPDGNADWLEYPILSQTISDYMTLAVSEISEGEIITGPLSEPYFGSILVLLKPCPALSSDILLYLTDQPAAVLMKKGEPLAIYGQAEDVAAAIKHFDYSSFETVEAPPSDAAYVNDTESAYEAQELIRARINTRILKSGVMLLSPETTFIGPNVDIKPGATILPGCLIYGDTVIAEGCKIGPNCLLEDASIGRNTSLNNAQVYESSIGDNCTVGPYCWVRPGCKVGNNVRLGNFVELKKAEIGDGTKVSHLSYVGDAKVGQRVNISCGSVFVNYDGKGKYQTTVGDDTMIGCNVNLIAPVNIGNDAYLAAGSTITEDVEDGAFAIARCRQTVKPQWVKKRREQGKL